MALSFVTEQHRGLGNALGGQTITFTPDPTTRMLLVYLGCESGSLVATTGLTWKGTNLVREITHSRLPLAHGELWYITFPPRETNGGLIFTSVGPSGLLRAVMCVFEFTGTEVGVAAIGTSASSDGLSNTLSTAWAADEGTSIIVDVGFIKGQASMNPGAGQTQRFQQKAGGRKPMEQRSPLTALVLLFGTWGRVKTGSMSLLRSRNQTGRSSRFCQGQRRSARQTYPGARPRSPRPW